MNYTYSVRRDKLIKELPKIAKAQNAALQIKEGGNHTKVKIADHTLIVPRHREINENTAKGILKDAQKGQRQ